MVPFFVRHPTAANIVLVLMILAGLFSLTRLNVQFFPDFGIDVITVTVTWSGASAEDVDVNVVQVLEPELRFLDGVDRINSTSRDGAATVVLEYLAGTDMEVALSEVEAAVDQVRTLPEDAEEPEVRRVVRYDPVTRIILSGPYPRASLSALARDLRDGLLARGVDKIDLFGVGEPEIIVEVPQARLRELDLTLADIANTVSDTSRDLPSGLLTGGEQKVRALGLRTTVDEVRDIVLRARPDGSTLRLGQVGSVTDDFEENGVAARYQGQPAVELVVQRALGADSLKIAAAVDAYLAEVVPTLPANLTVLQHDKAADLIEERIQLLVNNGVGGLFLVLLCLFVFLNGGVAFWVAAGIPVAMMATLAVMLATGQSINMVSLFGMIMAIGIVVDDAIVVGEHAEHLRRRGLSPEAAAIGGAGRMVAPVLSATLTTIAAFLPLFMISGIIGEIITAIPLVVITVLIASAVECFLVLPAHLKHSFSHEGRHAAPGWWRAFRAGFDRRFDAFREGPFRRAVERAVAARYATLAGAFFLFMLTLGLVSAGVIGFNFFPSPEPDRIFASLRMSPGTPRAATEERLTAIEAGLDRALADLGVERADLVRVVLVKIGTGVGNQGPQTSNGGNDTEGGIEVELVPSERRDIRARDLVSAWQKHLPWGQGVDSIVLRVPQGGPPGRAVDVRLFGEDLRSLKAAADALRVLLESYDGVNSLFVDLTYSTPEQVLEVTPRGRALGFSTTSVGREVRDALEGSVSRRFARGEEEVTLRVRLPRTETGLGVLERLWLRSFSNTEVPLTEVASIREQTGFSTIRRENGRRTVSLTGEVDAAMTTTGRVMQQLQAEGPDGVSDIERLARAHDVTYEFSGRAEEQRETFADMGTGAVLGIALIYLVLAWILGSFTSPLAILAIVPMGFVGAAWGHLILNYDLTILSLVALLGLSGIVVNDSIVLVTTIDERRQSQPLGEAIVDGTVDRLRAVLLTSLTTIGGLATLLFERSLQAQFLIPMALTFIGGLALATFLVLFVVPSLLAIGGDFRRGGREEPEMAAPLRLAAE